MRVDSPWVTVIAAFIIIGLYVFLIYHMFDLAGTPIIGDAAAQIAGVAKWDRTSKVFAALQTGAVQTIVIAAAGVLLGTVAQQARVNDAKAIADANVTDADKAKAARAITGTLSAPGNSVGTPDTTLDQVRKALS